MEAIESSSSSDELQLTVNTSYASKYDRWRSKEEYQKRVWSHLGISPRIAFQCNASGRPKANQN